MPFLTPFVWQVSASSTHATPTWKLLLFHNLQIVATLSVVPIAILLLLIGSLPIACELSQARACSSDTTMFQSIYIERPVHAMFLKTFLSWINAIVLLPKFAGTSFLNCRVRRLKRKVSTGAPCTTIMWSYGFFWISQRRSIIYTMWEINFPIHNLYFHFCGFYL